MDELKRGSDFEALIRIDENVKSIKKTLDDYPLPKLNEQISENCKNLDNHISNHWTYWVAAAAPALIAVIIAILEMSKK